MKCIPSLDPSLASSPRENRVNCAAKTPPPIPLGALRAQKGRKGISWALLLPRVLFLLLRRYVQWVTHLVELAVPLRIRVNQVLKRDKGRRGGLTTNAAAEVTGLKSAPIIPPLTGQSPDPTAPNSAPELRPQDPLIGKIIDHYQVISLLDEGAMGTVYKVEHIHLHKHFAMKIIRDLPTITPEFILRFQQEAKATSHLQHPHCVSTIDFGQTAAGRPYFVMELLEGQSLSALLDKPVAVSQALEIMHQALLGLSHAHEAGVIHRDLKPGNIMVTRTAKNELVIKLIDFGLARHQRLDPSKKSIKRITQARMVCGTPAYMAPELIRGQEADQRSDLYSIGVILFLLLTGRRPFFGESSHVILKNKFFFPALRLDGVAPGVFSRPLREILDRALHREPDQRFKSAEEFRLALQAVQRSRGSGLITRRPVWMALAPSRIGRTLRSYYYQISH